MFKKFWNWMQSNAALIGTFYWGTLAAIIKIWFPESGLPIVWENVYLTIGAVLTFLGVVPVVINTGKDIVKKFK